MMIAVTDITKIPRFDAEGTAKEIIRRHTNAYLQGCHAEYANNRDMMDDMYEECAFILSEDLLEGKLSPLQYAAVCNELGKMIWNIFEPHIKAEEKIEYMAWLASFM